MNFVERKAQEAEQAKQAQWQELKTKAPDLAKWLQEMAKVFGKVKLIKVEFRNL